MHNRLLAVLSALVILFVLVACVPASDEAPTPVTAQPATPTPVPTQKLMARTTPVPTPKPSVASAQVQSPAQTYVPQLPPIPVLTSTSTPKPSSTPTARSTITPTLTPTPVPTNTPISTSTPTQTPIPVPTPTPLPPSVTSSNEALVTKVYDGDTIDVQMGGITYTVRYIGIDTPESGDWLAEDATNLNKTLVYSKSIRLEKDTSDKDSFGRLLRYVYLDGLFVNAEMVKTGMARATSYPPDVKYEALFKQLEIEAANSAIGLWANPQIISVLFDGLVPKVESDEYVEIRNFTGKPVNIDGWKMKDSENHFFIFPNYILDIDKTIRVYTNENHPEWGNFSYKSTTAIWNNSGDTAVLYNNQGKPVSRIRYQAVQ